MRDLEFTKNIYMADGPPVAKLKVILADPSGWTRCHITDTGIDTKIVEGKVITIKKLLRQ